MPAENKASSILVVGSDGLIGGALLEQLECAGVPAIGTTRRRDSVTTSRSFLDLVENLEKWQPRGRPSVAVICAGVTKLDTCRLHPVSTARINVQAVSEIARKLADNGAFVIYLSTNQVFDGSRPNRPADDPTSARTEYGKQKAEVERRLLALGRSASIVRLTKVVPARMPLLQGWLDALRAGEAIHPFRDMVMAPVSLAFTVSVLRKLIDTRLPGIIQVSGERDITYAEAASRIAERAGAHASLVQPISVRDAGIPLEAVPRHTTLDTGRLRTELGLEPPDIWMTIDNAMGIQREELRA